MIDPRVRIVNKIQTVLKNLNWFLSEKSFQNAVLGYIWGNHRISFGHVTPELFEILKQNTFFLNACNHVQIMQHDHITELKIELCRLTTELDN